MIEEPPHGRPSPPPGRMALAVAMVLALVLATLTLWRNPAFGAGDPDFAKPWDHHKYIYMAEEGPFSLNTAPFCWRVLAPGLVHLMPLETAAGFRLLAWLAVVGGALLSYALVRALGHDPTWALCAMLLYFATGWLVEYPLTYVWSPDALGFLFLFAGLWCAVRDRPWLMMLAMAVGVTARENVIFLAPLFYTLHCRGLIDPRRMALTVAVTLPAILVLFGLRLAIPALNEQADYLARMPETLTIVQSGTGSYDLGGLLPSIVRDRLAALGKDTPLLYTADAFGVALFAFAGMSLVRSGRLWLQLSPLLVLTALTLLLAVNTQRLLIAAAPALIPLAVSGMQLLSRCLRVSAGWFAGLLVALWLLNLASGEFSFYLPLQLWVFVVWLILVVNRAGLIRDEAAPG